MSGGIIKEQVSKLHPCFGHARNKGRIHLPVCPACNIECNFCDRKINTYEDRPGVSGEILTPSEAVDALRRALEICPDISVAGIAGPGGGSDDKPVGRVWFGVSSALGITTESMVFRGGRDEVRASAVDHALGLLLSAASA